MFKKLTKNRGEGTMVSREKNLFNVLSLIVVFCLTGLLFSGCPLGAPINATKLEIGGPLEYGVLKAWKDVWYRFDVEKDNTPLILIFKNLGDAGNAWLGYQINWYYKAKGGLQLINSVEVQPTGPANPANIIIFADKARQDFVAPYKGTYYIRLYGYTQPVKDSKNYELSYAIGLAKPETYDDATEIAVGSVKEVNVVGDIISVFKLNASAGSVYRVKIEDTLDPNIVRNTQNLNNIDIRIVRMDEYGKVSTMYQDKVTLTDYIFATHSTDNDKYYLILENTDEFGNVRLKITFEQILAGPLSPSSTANSVTIMGEEAKAYKLNVESKKIYTIIVQNTSGVSVSQLQIDSKGNQIAFSLPLIIPENNTNEYYLVLKGQAKSTNATVNVTFNLVPPVS